MLLLMLALATMPTPIGPEVSGDLGAYSALYGETRPARTRIALTVSPAGQPVHCEVAVSGGSRVLDREACALLMRKARYTPARDAAGAPVAAVLRQDFTVNQVAGVRRYGTRAETAPTLDFALSIDRMPGSDPVLVADVIVLTDRQGHVTSCEVATSSTQPALDRAACRQLQTETFAPAMWDGQPIPALRQFSVGFMSGPVPR